MITYYQSNLSVSIDSLIPSICGFILLAVFYRFTPFSVALAEQFKIDRKKLFAIAAIAIFYLFLVNLNQYIHLKERFDELNQSQVHAVEGCIENYQVSHSNIRRESFEINDVTFTYDNTLSPGYFFQNRNYGDKFITIGRCVRVSYIRHSDTNFITKIEY